MLDYVREGDTLVVHSLDRLARNLADLRRMVTDLTSRGVRVEFRKESLVFDGKETALSGFLLNMLGGVAEFERALSRERQLEGVAIAKCCTTCGKPRVEHLTGMHKFKSRYMGRVSAIRASNGKLDILERLYADGAGVSVMAHEAGVSRQTVYSWLKSNGKAPNARYKPAEALVGNAHTRDAVRSYLVAMRALGRTKINTSEVADALALPVAEVDCIVSFLGKKGMEMLETTQRSDSNLLCAAD
jgi:DNA invertase Pin-like site-specific DNA recombinase